MVLVNYTLRMDHTFKDLSRMVKLVDRTVFSSIPMAHLNEEMLLVGNCKDMVGLLQDQETFITKASGKMINPTEEAFKFIQMDLDIKVNSLMAKRMTVMGPIDGQMEKFIKVLLEMALCKGMVDYIWRMEKVNILDNFIVI